MAYDRADWHYSGNYPPDLPPENGGRTLACSSRRPSRAALRAKFIMKMPSMKLLSRRYASAG
jgi:hypothetical protein